MFKLFGQFPLVVWRMIIPSLDNMLWNASR
jgi:hypothetical protein